MTSVRTSQGSGAFSSLGLRRNEIVALDIGDIDLGSATLVIVGKRRTEREKVTLSPELKDVLGNWLQFRRTSDPAQPLFTSVSRASNDGRLTGDGIYKVITDLGARTGISARPHGIRRAAVTAALDAFNGDFRKVRSFSRHSSLDIIRRYDDSRADHGGAVSKPPPQTGPTQVAGIVHLPSDGAAIIPTYDWINMHVVIHHCHCGECCNDVGGFSASI